MPIIDISQSDLGAKIPDAPDVWASRMPTQIEHTGDPIFGLGAQYIPGAGDPNHRGIFRSFFPPGEEEIMHGSDTPDPSFGSTLLSAFRQGNMLASGSAWINNRTVAADSGSYPLDTAFIMRSGDDAARSRDPDFNPWDAIKDTKYEPHWNSFVDVHNEAHANMVKRQIDMEEDDRRTLAGAPWYKSLPAQLIAGTLDLPTLIPGGAFVRGAAGGISIARSALMTGAAAGLGTSIQETGLHATQLLRTPREFRRKHWCLDFPLGRSRRRWHYQLRGLVTAIVCMRFLGAVYIGSDGLAYTRDGATALAPKVYTAPHVPLVVAARGPIGAADQIGTMIALMHKTFDDVVDRIEAGFPTIHQNYATNTGCPELPDVANLEIVLAGWSRRRSEAAAFFIKAGNWKLIAIDPVFAAPLPSSFQPAGDLTEQMAADNIIAILEAQRREFPQAVGGFVQLTTVTEDAISERILRRWDLPEAA